MKEALQGFTEKKAVSQLVQKNLRELPEWREAGVIYGFFPLSSEPDWRGACEDAGKRIAFPRVSGNAMVFYLAEEFRRGPLGAWEPVGGELAPPAELILVPGLAFDPLGHRLGRGGGYYDRWLEERGAVTTVGVCFDCQVVGSIPREDHDVRVDVVVTETRIFPG